MRRDAASRRYRYGRTAISVSVAIVGSGPSAFYTADALIKSGLDCRIDLIERLPTPYGLIRGGVAPDHQTTKRAERIYARIAEADNVAWFGNVSVGADVALDDLRSAYDAVILATGAPFDRPLGIPGEDKSGVYGSAAFVGWYNGHPDFANLSPNLNVQAAVVIGNGNVAIDAARVLVKTQEEMATSDLTDDAAAAIHASPITDVYMVGRRGAADAKFTNVELREMGRLSDCAPVVDSADVPDEVTGEMSDRDRRLKERNMATLREFCGAALSGKTKRVHFCFNARPVEILGGDAVEAVRLERTRVENGRAMPTGEFWDLPCGLVIPAIGYWGQKLDGAPFDADRCIVPNTDGRVAPGLFVVGWLKRGPSGVIGTNKPDGEMVAQHIRADGASGSKRGRPTLERLLCERGVRWLDFADWQRIDAAEKAAAAHGAPRRKFVRVDDMLDVVDRDAE